MIESVELEKALVQKHNPRIVLRIAEHSPGVFTLYDYCLAPVIVTENWNDILREYRRQPFVPTPSPAYHSGIDLSQLDLTI